MLCWLLRARVDVVLSDKSVYSYMYKTHIVGTLMAFAYTLALSPGPSYVWEGGLGTPDVVTFHAVQDPLK